MDFELENVNDIKIIKKAAKAMNTKTTIRGKKNRTTKNGKMQKKQNLKHVWSGPKIQDATFSTKNAIFLSANPAPEFLPGMTKACI